MTTFLLLYFTIYTLGHCYLLIKARNASLPVFKEFGRHWKPTVLLAALVILLVAAPIAVRVMERAGLERGPAILALVGYSWMGLLFLFVSLAAFTDLTHLLWQGAASLLGKGHNAPDPKTTFFLQLVLVLAIYGYGIHEARTIRTEHLVITSPALPAKTEGLRLVQISDVHLGLIVGTKRLEKILAEVRRAEPDLLIATGDLVDGQPDNLQGLDDMLAAVKTPLGKLAITGNHEFYAGLDTALAFTRAAGFQVLRNSSVTRGGVSFAGVDDRVADRFRPESNPDEAELLKKLPPDRFKILLKHRPEISPESSGLFDLQLSGHTHKGQIFPFSLVTRLFYPRPTGLSGTGKKGLLYHSRGTGTWGPPVRFLSPPEVTVIDLKQGKVKGIQAVEEGGTKKL